MKRAILAGVHRIEHGTYADDRVSIKWRRKTDLIPTLSAGADVSEKATISGWFPPVIQPKAARVGAQIAATFANAVKAGVPFAFGTDTGVFSQGANARAFARMVEAGVTSMQALQIATLMPAKLLGMSNELGPLEVSNRADIVAVPGDPLADIRVTERVAFVMKDDLVDRSAAP